LRFALFFIVLLFALPVWADDAYEIPGSTVFELKDGKTELTYPIYIKLPRSYRRHPDKTYPVIYLTDAPYSFPLVAGAIRFPVNSGKMEQVILVAVSYSKSSRGQSSRVRDFTHVKASSWQMETGGAAAHAEFFKSTLLPYIDKKYRTDPHKRTFVGNSLGGLFGTYLLFNHSDLFSAFVLGSPSVWFKEHHILSVEMVKLKAPKKVFVAVGKLERPEFGEGQDMVAGVRRLVDKIRAAKAKIPI
jgi:predicted alpha/beta superfamily hydrolase